MKYKILTLLFMIIPSISLAGSPIFDGISTRGEIGYGSRSMIAGFCIPWGNQKIVVGVLGPELGISGTVVSDTTLTLYNSYGSTVAYNRNWQSDYSSADTDSFFRGAGIRLVAGTAAVTRTLSSGCYTMVGTGARAGTGLVMAYDWHSPKIFRK